MFEEEEAAAADAAMCGLDVAGAVRARMRCDSDDAADDAAVDAAADDDVAATDDVTADAADDNSAPPDSVMRALKFFQDKMSRLDGAEGMVEGGGGGTDLLGGGCKGEIDRFDAGCCCCCCCCCRRFS